MFTLWGRNGYRPCTLSKAKELNFLEIITLFTQTTYQKNTQKEHRYRF